MRHVHRTAGSIVLILREFLIHAVDVEGKANGIEKELVAILGDWGKIRSHMQGACHSLKIWKIGSLDRTV